MAALRSARTKAEAKDTSRPGSMLRSFLIGILVATTVLGIAVFTSVRWTENQVFTTENWVQFVAPLPKDPEVNRAVSSYIVGRIFDPASVQARIEESLPPRAEFLAGPLTTQLEGITTRTAQRVVGSDNFQNIWTAANRAAHERVLARARSGPHEPGAASERFQLDLNDTGPVLRQALGRVAEALPERSEPLSVNADLQTRAQRLGQYIRAVDLLQDTLPYVLLATGLGALAIARDRRGILIIGSLLVFVLSLLQLIGVKALRPVVLDKVQDAQYRPAISELYDTLLASFNAMVYVALVIAALVWLAMVLAGPGSMGRWTRRFIRMNAIQETWPYVAWRRLRLWVADQRYFLWALAAILALFWLAFVATIDWRAALNTVFILFATIALVQVLGSPPYLIRVKR